MDGMTVRHPMHVYRHKCDSCEEVDEITTLPKYGELDRPHKCGGMLKFQSRILPKPMEQSKSPYLMFGHWKPDPNILDGEKERTAAGFYE